MHLEEGQIYEGDVSISGGPGPHRKWLVVAPFGRIHLHSLDDPLELHCLTMDAARSGIANGTLQLVDSAPEHPMLSLQREKERREIHDIHLGLSEPALESMYALLQEAVAENAPYAAHAAGEILALMRPELCQPDRVDAIRQWIRDNFPDYDGKD